MSPWRPGAPAVFVLLGNSLERDGTAIANRSAIRARISAALCGKGRGLLRETHPGGGARLDPGRVLAFGRRAASQRRPIEPEPRDRQRRLYRDDGVLRKNASG